MLMSRFGCVLLPDEPDCVAEGFDPSAQVSGPSEGGSGSWYDKRGNKRMLRLWGLSLGMTLDLLAFLPSALDKPIMVDTSRQEDPQQIVLGPKTPVTVTSSFDAEWDSARKVMEKGKAGAGAEVAGLANGESSGLTQVEKAPGMGGSGAGLDRRGSLGRKVDTKGMAKGRRRRGVGPGVTAVFPRFSYPDVNFWIWVFGRRYRKVVKGWEQSVRGPVRAQDRR
jgi:hypothetical protein